MTNTLRLIVDFFRRTKQPWAVLLFAYFWLLAERGSLRLQWVMAGCMTMVIMFGPVAAFALLTSRVAQLLPVSRREIWLARWWLGLAIPVGIAAAGKLAGAIVARISGDPVTDWQALSLSIVYDAVFPSLFMGAVPLMRGPWRWVAVVVYAGGGIWPILLINHLPTTWPALVHSPIGLAAAAALALGLNSCRFRPHPAPYPSPRDSTPLFASSGSARPPRVELGARLTGLRKLVWWEWLLTLRNLSVIVTAYVVVAGGIALWSEPQPGMEALLREIRMLPFDQDSMPSHVVTAFLLLGFLGIGAGYSSTLHSDFLHAMTRALRALPIGTVRLLALLAAMPLLAWLTLCVMLLVIQTAVTGRLPGPVRYDVLLLFPALDMLARSLQFRWRRDVLAWHFIVVLVVLSGVVAVVELTGARPTLSTVRPPIIVAAIVGLATLLNYLTLTRSRAPYRPAPRSVPS